MKLRGIPGKWKNFSSKRGRGQPNGAKTAGKQCKSKRKQLVEDCDVGGGCRFREVLERKKDLGTE
jgi:hypothetical protein